MKKGSEVSKGYAVFFLLLIGVVVWWNVSYPSYSFNYKITVEIETPEGVKSGSAVREVTVQWQHPLNPDIGSIMFNIFGEAVAVDLGEKGFVFALIDEDSYNEVLKAFPSDIKKSEQLFKYYKYIEIGTKADLLEMRPKMITYTDIKDPKTSEIVYWQQNEIDKFEEIFGKGVYLKSVNIEITKQDVSWGNIDRFMPFFDDGYYSIKYSNFKRKH